MMIYLTRSEEDSFALLGTGCAIRRCERSVAISSYKDEIATLPSVTRNDNLLYEIATPFQGSQ